MPDETGPLVGPNAILQMEAPLRRHLGEKGALRVWHQAKISTPSGNNMIPQADALALHKALYELSPKEAERVSREGGARTAAYIVANRIPKVVKLLFRILPTALAGPLLARAIAKHAWTFAGSGDFSVTSTNPLVFEIDANPLAFDKGEAPSGCHWHMAVFASLFSILLRRPYIAREPTCCGRGAKTCRFVLTQKSQAACATHG